tara:strand:- start:217 stop:342 length:126 start_codon:yes stop_codon:yes gene_type:complete
MAVIESTYTAVKKFRIGSSYNVLTFACFYAFNKEAKTKKAE